MSLTMEEFLAKRRKLEDDIRALLVQFEKETGYMPRELRAETYCEQVFGPLQRRRRILGTVRVDVDIE